MQRSVGSSVTGNGGADSGVEDYDPEVAAASDDGGREKQASGGVVVQVRGTTGWW